MHGECLMIGRLAVRCCAIHEIAGKDKGYTDKRSICFDIDSVIRFYFRLRSVKVSKSSEMCRPRLNLIYNVWSFCPHYLLIVIQN